MLAGLALLKVALIPFSEGVKSSESIVVGRVTQVVKIQGHRFADLAVERTLKGKHRSRVRFLAEPTWTCDSSDAKFGERGVFLLDRIEERNHWIDSNPGLEDAVEAAGTEKSVYQLDHSGSGRIVVPKELQAWKMSDGAFVINMYMLPKGLRPGKVDAEGGRFEETKFVSAVQAMVHGQTFEGTVVKGRSPSILRQP